MNSVYAHCQSRKLDKRISPLVRIIKSGSGVRYEKEYEFDNVSGTPVELAARFAVANLKKFRGAITPGSAALAPGEKVVGVASLMED